MLYLVIKYLLSALVIVLASEIAKRTDKIGALIASIPWVSLMIMVWIFAETRNSDKVANHAFYTFWYVLPTMPMFLLLPWMLRNGSSFALSMACSIGLTVGLFLLVAVVSKCFGLDLF
jgi:uncharacterized membrane protein (GlpM family)